MKKLTSLLLCVAMLSVLVAACAPAAPATTPAPAPAAAAPAAPAPEAAAPAPEAPEAAAPADPAAAPAPAAAKALVPGTWKIGLANGYMGNTWRAQYVEAWEKKAQEYKDAGYIADFIVASTNTDVTEQLNQINNMISNGVNAICINIISPASVIPIFEICKEAGVMLVVSADPAGVDAELIEVLTDNGVLFEIMTKWFAETLGGKGNIVKITGVPGMPATGVRQAVADSVLKNYPDIVVLGSAPGSWSQTEAQAAMSTFLSTYDQIDGVLTEDVMGEGIIRAYETAGKTPPIMTGDYVMSFFRKWETMPDLNSCVTTFQPDASANSLMYALRVLNGWELDPVNLVANPLDNSLINSISVPPSYCVTKEKPTGNEAWTQGYNLTKFISLSEALEIGKDLSDTASLGAMLTEAEMDAMFR